MILTPVKATSQENSLILPILGALPRDLINQFLAPETLYSSGHRGIDLKAAIGTEVISPASGQITFRGQVGFRNLVTISFGNSMKASVEPVCSELAEGTLVSQGTIIGFVCEPSIEYQWHCPDTCIHFGTRTEQGYFSPLALMNALPPSRLVPYARG